MPTPKKFSQLSNASHSKATEYLLLDHAINSSIEPAGPGATLCLGPAKVAKIKAYTSFSPMAKLEAQVALAVVTVPQCRLFITTAANDSHGRMAA